MGLAIAFMWFLYPQQINYSDVLKSGTFFYEANMLGPLPDGYRIPWRGDSFTNDTNVVGDDLTGGWITGGPAGLLSCRLCLSAYRSPSLTPACSTDHLPDAKHY